MTGIGSSFLARHLDGHECTPDMRSGIEIKLLKCSICGKELPDNAFSPDKRNASGRGRYSQCKTCFNQRRNARMHENGVYRPIEESKDSSSYLGVYVAERVLSKYFDNIIKMPYGNPGYDFLCGKGFKIDVKSSCLRHPRYASPIWAFSIKQNEIADFFLCLGFDDRRSLNPIKMWLIPGWEVSHLKNMGISVVSHRFDKYEKPIDKVIACCNTMKNHEEHSRAAQAVPGVVAPSGEEAD